LPCSTEITGLTELSLALIALNLTANFILERLAVDNGSSDLDDGSAFIMFLIFVE